MQCPNCRTMNEADASFCENCGTRLAAGMPVMQPIVQGPPVKVSRPGLFAAMLWIGLILMFFVGVLSAEGEEDGAAIVAIPGLVLIVAAWIYSLVTLHRCWSVL